MFKWLSVLNKTEKKTLYACFGGWAVDALDTQLYSFLIPTLIAAWSMTQTEAGLLGTSALVSSSIGGWVAGILCDRVGRVRVMKIAIVWFACFTVLSGFTDSYWELFTTRILSGIGFGGEWAAGSVLMGEIIRAEHRGKAVGTVQSSYAVGYAIAALMSAFVFAQLPDAMAWRAMFFLGATPALIVFWLLRGVTEPDVFVKAKAAKAASGEVNVSPLAIFHPRILRTTILTSMLALGIQAGGFSLGVWLPTFLKTMLAVPAVEVGYVMTSFSAGSFFGYIAAAYMCDLIGRRRNFVLFVVLCWVTIAFFLYVPVGKEILYVVLFCAGFASLGIYAACGPYFTELFPTEIRANGQGFAYNFGRGVGAFFPTLIGVMLTGKYLPFRDAIATTCLGSYFFVLLAVALLPETRGCDLSKVGVTPEKPMDAAPVRMKDGRVTSE